MVGAAEIPEAERRAAAGRLTAAGVRRPIAVEQPHLHLRDDPSRGPQPVVPGVPGGRRAQHAGLVGAVELQNRHPGQVLELGRLGVGAVARRR